VSEVKYVQTFVRGLPADIGGEIRSRVDVSETTMNDLVCSILARKFKIKFEASGRHTKGLGPGDDIALRMPEELRRALKVAAAERDTNVRDLIVQTLADEFKLPFTRAPRMAA
jgi:hypothetical protein